MELVESTDVLIIDRKDASDGNGKSNSEDIPIIDRKHASDGNGKSNSEDIPGKCYVVPISFCFYTYFI